MEDEIVQSAGCTMWSCVWSSLLDGIGLGKRRNLLVGCSACVSSKRKNSKNEVNSSKQTALKRLLLAPPGCENLILNDEAEGEDRALSDHADSDSSYVSLSELPVEVDCSDEDTVILKGRIGYTVAAEGDTVNGRIVSKDEESFASFTARNGRISIEKTSKKLCNDVIPIRCEIRNARAFERRGLRPPRLCTHGFELLSGLEMMPPPQIGNQSAAERFPSSAYLHELERIVRRATGADAVRVVSHCRRLPPRPRSRTASLDMSSATNLKDSCAQTDISHASWPELMPHLEHDLLPSALSRSDALRATRAARYSVVTAWRYLGPAQTCHHSHLALLDPTTLDTDDFIHFHQHHASSLLQASNYCLKAPDLDDPTADVKRHSWWYYPGICRDSELLLYTVYDTKKNAFAKANTLPIPSIFHSTFTDPSGYHEPERDSIQIQLLLIWDDHHDDDDDDDVDDDDDDDESLIDEDMDNASTSTSSVPSGVIFA